MKNLIMSVFFLIIVMIINVPTFGQVLTPNFKGKQSIYINIGLDPAVLTTFGYSYRLSSENFWKDIILFGEASIPVGEFEINDYRIKVGIQNSLVNSDNWNFSLAGYFMVRGTENSIHSATNYGLGILALAGYYESDWFSAFELGYDKGILTDIKHTDWYRDYFYSDVRDGLYSNPSGNISLGLRGGYLISDFEITLRAGIAKTEMFNNPVGVPFYSTVCK
ncbi:MAG: hypothetical protein V3V16_05545 [Melioribacteraceae bacterium]